MAKLNNIAHLKDGQHLAASLVAVIVFVIVIACCLVLNKFYHGLPESFSNDCERIGKLIVTSKHQNNYFLLE